MLSARRAEGGTARKGCGVFPRAARERERRARRDTKGGILFPKRIPPLNPPEKGEGRSPRPPTLAVCSLNDCTRCAIGCCVHGFAMSLYYSSPIATAPYYREARVTLERRQTVCRMRHCCARRIEQCLGRRKLLRTSTRQAERQRIVGAEASRIATFNAALPRADSAIGKHCTSSSCQLAMQKPFSWGI